MAVLEHCRVGAGTDYLDAGCGAGMAAGLGPQAVVDVDSGWRYPDEATALRGLGSSGVAARVRGLVGAQAVDDAHRAALAPFRQADGSFRIGASCRFLVAMA